MEEGKKAVEAAFRALEISADGIITAAAVGMTEEGGHMPGKRVKMAVPMYPLRTSGGEAHRKLRILADKWDGKDKQKQFVRRECELCKAYKKTESVRAAVIVEDGPRCTRTIQYCFGCGERNPHIKPTDMGVFLCDKHWDAWHTLERIDHVDFGLLRVNFKPVKYLQVCNHCFLFSHPFLPFPSLRCALKAANHLASIHGTMNNANMLPGFVVVSFMFDFIAQCCQELSLHALPRCHFANKYSLLTYRQCSSMQRRWLCCLPLMVGKDLLQLAKSGLLPKARPDAVQRSKEQGTLLTNRPGDEEVGAFAQTLHSGMRCVREVAEVPSSIVPLRSQ